MPTDNVSANNVTANNVTTKRFELVDDKGETRALMSTRQGEPFLKFFDSESNARLDIEVVNDWPVVHMRDEKGNVRVEFGSLNGKPALYFRDHAGQLRMGLVLSTPDAFPRLVFLDDDGNVRFGVVTDSEGTPRVISVDQVGQRHKLLWFSEARQQNHVDNDDNSSSSKPQPEHGA